MPFRTNRCLVVVSAAIFWCSLGGFAPAPAHAQSSGNKAQQSSSSNGVSLQEKAPSLVDPAGPTISLVSSEPVFDMAAALNACGYEDGLDESSPVRKRVREEINQSLAKSEDARSKRDK